MAMQEDKYSKRRLQSSLFISIISTSLVLFMLGLLGLIILYTKKLSDYVKENIGFSIIINEDVKEAGIIRLQKILDASDYVKSTEYITKEQAAKDLSVDLGEDFIGFLGYNPLLPSIDVRFKAEYANNDSLAKIKKTILINKEVKEVFYQESLVDAINSNVRKISLLIVSFSGILLLISIALINNTIRLSVFSRRFLIKSMQLVGATEKFISKPFIIKGITNGLISAFVAILLLITVIYLAQNELPELISMSDIDLFLSLFLFVILLGFLISWLSNYLAVRKYLRIKADDLYIY